MTAYDYNPNVGLFIASGQICKGLVQAWSSNAGCQGNVAKTLISSDFGETFVEKAEFRPGSVTHDSCAVFLNDTTVRKLPNVVEGGTQPQ